MKRIIFTTISILLVSFSAFSQVSENICPKFEITGTDRVLQPKKAETISIKASEEIKKYNVEYIWSISTGEIVKGQGTSTIEVMVKKENSGENLHITVEIKGLPINCGNTFTDVAPIAPIINWHPPNYGKVSKLEEKAYLDNFIIDLNSDANLKGIMILKFEPQTSINKRIERIRGIIKWLKYRKFALNRITFMILEEDPERTFLISVPPDYDNDDLEDYFGNDYTTVKAEEFEQKINEIFPNK